MQEGGGTHVSSLVRASRCVTPMLRSAASSSVPEAPRGWTWTCTMLTSGPKTLLAGLSLRIPVRYHATGACRGVFIPEY